MLLGSMCPEYTKDWSCTGLKLHRLLTFSQGDSVEARIQPTDRTDYSMLREQPRQTDAGASEAEIGHRQEDTRQVLWIQWDCIIIT